MKKNFLIIAKQLLKCLLIAVVAIVVLKSYFDSQLKLKYDLIERQYISIDDVQVKLVIESELNRNSSFNVLPIAIQKCSFIPPDLKGRIKIEHTILSDEQLEQNYSSLFMEHSGGHWKPKSCQARYKVAIVVPYRNRKKHLNLFLNHMHRFLQNQQIDYAIYIVEEVQNKKFNRALLMNIGYKEAIKDYDWACFVFHDVDLVPEDDRNLYYCPFWPRHMSATVNTLKYKLPYKEIFGGVSAISKEHFEFVNGYSNSYFGWGGEDDDFAKRIISNGLRIIRYPPEIARYHMLLHSKDAPNKIRFNLLESAKKRFKTDGLNSLKYLVVKKEYRRLYTWILVSFDETK